MDQGPTSTPSVDMIVSIVRNVGCDPLTALPVPLESPFCNTFSCRFQTTLQPMCVDSSPSEKVSFEQMCQCYSQRFKTPSGCSSVGRALASQAEGRGFEPRHPLSSPSLGLFVDSRRRGQVATTLLFHQSTAVLEIAVFAIAVFAISFWGNCCQTLTESDTSISVDSTLTHDT